MAPRARCWRVHSALTQKVNAIEAIHDRLHAACEGIQSGQLPFLALNQVGALRFLPSGWSPRAVFIQRQRSRALPGVCAGLVVGRGGQAARQ